MMAIHVRRATDSDAERIAEYNLALAAETEERTLDAAVVLAGVRRGLQLVDEVQYWMAECDGVVAGQLMLTREWSDWRNGWQMWLQSVYVQPEFRRRGVFRSLFDNVRRRLEAEPDVIGIRLYVEHANVPAQATYASHGFVDSGYHVVERPLSR